MNLIPGEWIVIGSQVLSFILMSLGIVDLNYHTHLLDNPLTLTVMGILNILGIHQTIAPIGGGKPQA